LLGFFGAEKLFKSRARTGEGKEREITGVSVLPLRVSMRWKLYSTWRGIVGPVLAQARAVDLLVHYYRVRKFPSETDDYLPSFKEMD
jgi:hypothetical protein